MSSDVLTRDLAMVYPRLASGDAMVPPRGAWPDPAALAASLRAARAPAIAGAEHLTIEGVREALALAEAVRGRLLLDRPQPPAPGHDPVAMLGSLGHIFSSEMILWVGCRGTDGPVARAIAADQLLASFLPADLPTVRRLRTVLHDQPDAEPIGSRKRIGVVLAPGCDRRVASQWHKLAADMQHHLRISVLALPDPEDRNRRGAAETATWQTGLSLEAGGIDFSDGSPRRCPDLEILQARRAIDVLVDLRTLPTHEPGTAARVMRFDGIVLWLCDDPAQGTEDHAAAWLRTVREHVTQGG